MYLVSYKYFDKSAKIMGKAKVIMAFLKKKFNIAIY